MNPAGTNVTPWATITIEARVRRLWLAKALVRVAGWLRSVRLARWGVGLLRLETRIGHGKWTDAGHFDIEVTVSR